MQEEGVVLESLGDKATVRVERSGACETCNACRTLSDGARVVETINAAGAAAGDRVMIEVPDSQQLKAAAMVYLLPLLGFLCGAIGCVILTGSEKLGMLWGVAGLALVYSLVFCYDRRYGRRRQSWPEIIRVIEREGDNNVQGG